MKASNMRSLPDLCLLLVKIASPPFFLTTFKISSSSVQTTTLPILLFFALLTTWEIMGKLFILNSGFPGSLEAYILDGIKIIVFDIIELFLS